MRILAITDVFARFPYPGLLMTARITPVLHYWYGTEAGLQRFFFPPK